MLSAIGASLGVGSGIDTARLVSDLTAAAREPRAAVLAIRGQTNAARLTALATLDGALRTLADRTQSPAPADDDVLVAQVADLVATLNTLRTSTRTAIAGGTPGRPAGPLAGDPGPRALDQALGALTWSETPNAGVYTRLGQIGLSAGRDGVFTLDQTRLRAALAEDGASVRSLVAGPASGLAVTIRSLRDRMTGSAGALTQAQARYTRIDRQLGREQERLEDDMDGLTVRLERSFATMDVRVAALRASQAYLKQQIDVWTAAR